MPKETQKVRKGSDSLKIKAGSASGHDVVFGSGAPAISVSLAPAPALLDTSEYVPLSAYYEGNSIRGKENLKQKLINRARSKYVTGLVAVPLSKLVSPLQKQYKSSEKCAGSLTETPGKLTAMYCGCRWCLVCSRIRTAKMIAGYLPAIEAMETKFFLTLSRPNVKKADLEKERRSLVKTSQLINRYLREKLKLSFSFIRKLECTYNEEADTYHPHFHFIIDNELAAYAMLSEWLDRSPTALLNKGNQLKKADNNSVAELFKYFTKVVSKSKSKASAGFASDYRIHLTALDTMFVALRGARTFQAGGLIKTVSEEIEPSEALDSGRFRADFWQWNGTDWLSRETAEALTGYIPSHGIQDITAHLVYPAGVAVAAAEVLPTATALYVDRETGEIVPNESAHHAAKLPGFVRVVPEVTEKPVPLDGNGFKALPDSAEIMLSEFGPWPLRLCVAPVGYESVTSPAGRLLVRVAPGLAAGRTTSIPARESSSVPLIVGKKLTDWQALAP